MLKWDLCVKQALSSTSKQALELLPGPARLDCQKPPYQKVNTQISDAFLILCLPLLLPITEQLKQIMTNATELFLNVSFILAIEQDLQTSYFDPRLSKGTNPSLKSIKFCHRFQGFHNFTCRAFLFIFLNAPFTLAIPSEFLKRFHQCCYGSKGGCTRSPRGAFAPSGRGLGKFRWHSAKESQVWSLLNLPPACFEV